MSPKATGRNKIIRAALNAFVKGKKRTRGGNRVSPKAKPQTVTRRPAEDVNMSRPNLRPNPPIKHRGGSHGDLKVGGKVIKGTQINHIPPDSTMKHIPGWKYSDGGAIQMDLLDHRQVSSTGGRDFVDIHRKHQLELINNGQIREAIDLDVQDIRRRFGNKYDDAINEMMTQVYPDYL